MKNEAVIEIDILFSWLNSLETFNNVGEQNFLQVSLPASVSRGFECGRLCGRGASECGPVQLRGGGAGRVALLGAVGAIPQLLPLPLQLLPLPHPNLRRITVQPLFQCDCQLA